MCVAGRLYRVSLSACAEYTCAEHICKSECMPRYRGTADRKRWFFWRVVRSFGDASRELAEDGQIRCGSGRVPIAEKVGGGRMCLKTEVRQKCQCVVNENGSP